MICAKDHCEASGNRHTRGDRPLRGSMSIKCRENCITTFTVDFIETYHDMTSSLE